MDQSEFERDLAIDPEALDVECLRQADAFYRWAQRAIDARGKVDRLKLRLETVKASLALRCRKKPEDFDLEGRVTEASVEAAVATHEKHLAAAQALHEARSDSAMLDRAVDAMEQRKRMLELLVTLHGQSYFASPSAPRDLGRAYLDQQKASEDRVNKRQIKISRKRGS